MSCHRSLFATIVLIVALLILACSGPSPEAVTRGFLETMQNGEWSKAAAFVDTANVPPTLSTLQSQGATSAEKDKDSERLLKLILSKITYTIGSTKVEGDRATVKAQIKAVDLRKVVAKYISDILPLVLASAFSGGKATDLAPQMNKYMEDAVRDPEAPMTTTDIDVKLVRIKDQWRISAANVDLVNVMTGNLLEIAKTLQSTPVPIPGVPSVPPPRTTPLSPTVGSQPTATPTPAVGFSRSRPALIGTRIRAVFKEKDSERVVAITVREFIRGAEAWTKIKAANQFNDAPVPAYEYLLAWIEFKYETGPADVAWTIDSTKFTAISSQGKEYETPFVILPKPEIYAKLYAGASHEGWAVFMVTTDDRAPVMAFGRAYDGTRAIWFKLSAD